MERATQYMIPTLPHEVTIREAIKWRDKVDSLQPAYFQDDDHNVVKLSGLTKKKLTEVRLFLETNMCFWSQCSVDVAKTMTYKELVEIYKDTKVAVWGVPKYEYCEVMKIGGVLYGFPSIHMKKGMLFQYMECDQRETNIFKHKQSVLHLLPQLMALLLREDGQDQWIEDEQIDSQIERFKGATMAEAWQVFRYYEATKAEIRKRFGKTLYGSASAKEKKAGIQNLQEAYGWLLTVKRLAEKKIFDLGGFNSQGSVLRTNLWEGLAHLSAENSINKYQERLTKQDK